MSEAEFTAPVEPPPRRPTRPDLVVVWPEPRHRPTVEDPEELERAAEAAEALGCRHLSGMMRDRAAALRGDWEGDRHRTA